ncbi:MAG: SpoIID/LytB domain-containing protein [Candidatus Shapirobacteria bacterium]|nr:SpoIID/LytB domain-containing protein [Candidatus Shapirobacteria bacterium]
MKRLLIVLLFLIIPFFQPTSAFAQSVTTATTDNQTTTTTATPEESLWIKFWNWISSVFIKTDYTIAKRPLNEINSDMTNYSTTSDNSKHSSSGTRLTDSNSQTCYKGNVIKKVILDKSGYPNTNLAQICNSSNGCVVSSGSESDCQTITIKDLAHYFVQTNQQFYCNDQNKLINIDSDVINAVNTNFSESISSANLDCYQAIYDDFYLIPKDTDDKNEENSKNIVQTPISASNQDSNDGSSIKDLKKQLNQNLTPKGKKWDSSLNFLCPANWKRGLSEAGVGTGSYEGGTVGPGTCNAKDSHCRGMSTIGAYGLAKSGKTYEEILKNYYGDISLKTIDASNANITIVPNSNDDCSSTTLNLETYLSGLREIPDSWGDSSNGGYESLKAQVVAARTYAYVYTQNLTKSICTSSRCQNVRCDAINTNPNLDKAIKDTEGQIIVDSSKQTPFATEYARSFCGPSLSVTYTNHSTPSFNGYDAEVSTGEKLYCL